MYLRRIIGAATIALTLSVPVFAAGAPDEARRLVAGEIARGWGGYLERFVTEDGRVIDDFGGISHSEGQGYAMLIAVMLNDRENFDRIWSWTQRELFVREDGLAAWRWDPDFVPPVTDKNNATDGDILIAWALEEGARRFEDPALTEKARALATTVGRTLVEETAIGPVLMPAREGFSAADRKDGPVVNPSYWIFPAFETMAELDPQTPWARVRETGMRLLRAARQMGPSRLPSDWMALGNGRIAPAEGFAPRYSFNAVRVPLYLVWAGHSDAADLEPFTQLWHERLNLGPFEIDVVTGDLAEPMTNAGYRAVAALTDCAALERRFPDSLRRVPIETYYATTLHLFSLAVLVQRYPQCL